MRIHNFWYLIKQGFKNVLKNGTMSFSCVGVLVACMMLIGSAVFFTITVNNIVGSVEQYNEIVVDLEKGGDAIKVETKLKELSNIVEIRFISKEEGLETLNRSLSGTNSAGKELLTGLKGDENPLPDRYVIRIEDNDKIERTIAELAAIEDVEDVKASQEVARILSGVKQTVYYAGIGIVAILIVVSLAIITNTIKITILSRKREINIMKYVGATDMFIRLPFLVEGVVIGIIAAFLAFFILGVGYPRLIEWARDVYGQKLTIIFDNIANFDDVRLQLLGGFSVLGAGIGLLSGTVFVRKYLKV